MTRKRAAEVLRELLGEGDASEFGQALEVAVRLLAPVERKPKPKVSPNVAAFLKLRFPVGLAADRYPEQEGYRDREKVAAANPALVAQFRYGMRGAGVPGHYEVRFGKAQDEATLALVLNAERWAPDPDPAEAPVSIGWRGMTPSWALDAVAA